MANIGQKIKQFLTGDYAPASMESSKPVPEVTVSGPVDFAKGETRRFEVTINIPKDIKLQIPSYTRQRSGSYSYHDSRPFTRNHRQQWYAGAELHTGGLNLDDQRSIHVDH